MAEETRIEIDAPPQERSILVLQGTNLNEDQVIYLKEGLEKAIAEERWPILLNYDGPVYWVPVGFPNEVAEKIT